MNLKPEELTAISALAGAFIGGFFTFLGIGVVAFIRERNENRRQLRESAVEMAKAMHEAQIRLCETGKVRVNIRSIDYYFLYYFMMASKVEGIKKGNPGKALAEFHVIGDELNTWLQSQKSGKE